MSDSDDLLSKKKEFVEAFFRKGAEFTEEILRENEKLRYRVVQLEEQLASAARAIPTPATLKELVEKIHALEKERVELLARFAHVEAENHQYETRYHEIERENNNLASLYVAASQLHSTLDLREVLQVIVEIVLNFVGARTFALYLLDEDADIFRAVAAEGVLVKYVPARRRGDGVVGRTAETGEPHFGDLHVAATAPEGDPAIAIPLRFQGRVVGMIAIWAFLTQKTELLEVDYEIFRLLGAHAASALEAARLLASSSGAARLRFAAFEGLL